MANVEDWIRNMFIGTSPETTAEEMMDRLVSRFGVNMTSTEVENKMLGLERKPGEDLYSLADRVRSLAYRAEFSQLKRNIVMRQALFVALRGNTEMQHYISRHDNQDEPNMDRTLDLAIAWERRHGTNYKTEKVRQVSAYSSDPTETTDWRSSEESGEAEINKINYVPVREMTTEEGRKLAKQNNELVALMRKQAYAVLEEDKRAASSSSFRGRSSRQGRSDYSSRSSSSWSKPRRSRSRERKSTGRREWRSDDKRRRSGDRNRRRSKDRDYKKKGDKYDKKKREARVQEIRDESPSDSESSQASEQSHSESEGNSE